MNKLITKILNIIGYLTILSVPVLLLAFFLILHTPVKIACCIALILLLMIQIIHVKKTKIKYIGIRILATLISIILLTVVIHTSYGMIKTVEGNILLNNINKIEYGDHELDKYDLSNAKVEFVNEKHMLIMSYQDSKIYYDDGTIEMSTVKSSGALIFEIKGNNYYIRCPKLSLNYRP